MIWGTQASYRWGNRGPGASRYSIQVIFLKVRWDYLGAGEGILKQNWRIKQDLGNERGPGSPGERPAGRGSDQLPPRAHGGRISSQLRVQ